MNSPTFANNTATLRYETVRQKSSHAVIIRADQDKPAQYYAAKRLLDVVLSILLLLLLVPLLLFIAVFIKLDSRGPILFVQARAGANKLGNGDRGWGVCAFRCYKFRSMHDKADETIHKAYTAAFIRGETISGDQLFKLTGDQRVTRVGRVLRKLSLDELPQLVNVLKGDMSLVGPRPVPTYELAVYEPHHWQRLAAKPGITGLWQVRGRCRVDFESMVRMDVEYIKRQSLWLDLKLLALTLPAVMLRKGAE